jgi:hypothetical protein
VGKYDERNTIGMATVTITFDTDEQSQEIQDTLNGTKWKAAVWEIDQHLRNIVKYGDVSEKEFEQAENLRKAIREILNGYQLILD